jgi:hypothetical protein
MYERPCPMWWLVQWHSAGLWAGWSGVRIPAGAGNFFLLHRVQTGSGAHPASYPMGTGGSLSEGKAAGAWNWPPPFSAEVKNAILPLPQDTFMAWRSVKAQGLLFP